MLIRYGCEFNFETAVPTPVQCLVDIHPDRRPDIVSEDETTIAGALSAVADRDAFGNFIRRFVVPPGPAKLKLLGMIRDPGAAAIANPEVGAVSIAALPPEILVYVNGSRYCETDLLTSTAWQLFGSVPPGAQMVQAICDYVHSRLTFGYPHARATRTAFEAHGEQVGVCRDFAHLAVTFCRCMNIPARYVNGYLGDIGVEGNPAPMDFNAWFEAYLDGGWYTFDARHNRPRIGRLVIARGRDAADVPMLLTFGPHTLHNFKVTTEQVIDQPLSQHAA